MHIDRFGHDDVDVFLELADAEGWVCDRWEFDFLLRAFPGGCLVGRVDGRAAAFVTGIKYDKSGWIGNLLVRRDLRAKGGGSALMKRVLDVLGRGGVETVWLTASEAGKSIYERLGFAPVDTIKRWKGSGLGGKVPEPDRVCRPDCCMAMDEAGWGDRREAIISAVAERGTVFGCEDGFLMIQKCGDSVQLGPWGCADRETAARLLEEALLYVGAGVEIVLDAPVGNISAASLLIDRGFHITGSTTLMCLGQVPRYNPGIIFSLASLGSMG